MIGVIPSEKVIKFLFTNAKVHSVCPTCRLQPPTQYAVYAQSLKFSSETPTSVLEVVHDSTKIINYLHLRTMPRHTLLL